MPRKNGVDDLRHDRVVISDDAGKNGASPFLRRPSEDVSVFLRGWAGYFRYGHSAGRLSSIRPQYARTRLALFISKKHRRRPRGSGGRALISSSPHNLGLMSLYGITIAPRPKALAGNAECRR